MEPSKKHIIPTIIQSLKKKHNYWLITMKDTYLVLKSLKNSTNLLKEYWKRKIWDDGDKLEVLYGIETHFIFTGQDRIPVNDIEACFMKGKKGNYMVAYNIQSAVDYDTKLICAINITQNLTDHYELPEIAKKKQYKT